MPKAKTVTVTFINDQRYPDFDFVVEGSTTRNNHPDHTVVGLSEARRWRAAISAYNKAQLEMQKAFGYQI